MVGVISQLSVAVAITYRRYRITLYRHICRTCDHRWRIILYRNGLTTCHSYYHNYPSARPRPVLTYRHPYKMPFDSGFTHR